MKTVVVKGGGGMGNRMLCAASGILWSKLANRRVYIDWRDGAYSYENDNSFFYFFENKKILKDCPVKSEDVYPKIWYNHEDCSVSKMLSLYDPDKFSSCTIHRKYSIDPKKITYQNQTVFFWHYIGFFEKIFTAARTMLPEYANMNNHKIIQKAIVDYLPPSDSIKDSIERYKKQMFETNMIGVHVRYTDRLVNVNKIVANVNKIVAKLDRYKIFLCTDNKSIQDLFCRKYKNVCYSNKWFPDNNLSTHYNNQCPNAIQNGTEALVDMYLLSQCDFIIHSSRSTFSQISCTLSEVPSRIIIDIDKFNLTNMIKKYIRKIL